MTSVIRHEKPQLGWRSHATFAVVAFDTLVPSTMLVKICWGQAVRCRDAPRAGCEVGAGDTDRSRSGNAGDMPSMVLLVDSIRRLIQKLCSVTRVLFS